MATDCEKDALKAALAHVPETEKQLLYESDDEPLPIIQKRLPNSKAKKEPDTADAAASDQPVTPEGEGISSQALPLYGC